MISIKAARTLLRSSSGLKTGMAMLLGLVIVTMSSTAVAQQSPLPPEYQNYKWFWFKTANFEIMSIDWEAGWQAAQRVESLRAWTFKRWDLPDSNFDKKCLIVLVPDQQTFQKWFRKSPNIDPKVAKSKNADGSSRDVYGVWLTTEGSWLTSVLPEKVSFVSLMAFESQYRVQLGYWAKVGMSSLSNDVTTLRSMFAGLQPIDARTLFSTTPQGEVTDPAFKAQAAAACLLLRKQPFGCARFVQCLQRYSDTHDPAQSLSVFGWSGIDDFSRNYQAYVINLAYDVQNNVTPDMGFLWLVKR